MKLPQLRLHATGQYFVRFHNRYHYLGVDPVLAHGKYLALINSVYMPEAQRRAHQQTLARVGARMTILELAESYLHARAADGLLPRTIYCYRMLLAPLLHAYGPLVAVTFDANLLRALACDLQAVRSVDGRQHYTPKTLLHFLNTARMLFRWGRGEGLLDGPDGKPVPMDLSIVRSPRVPAPRPRAHRPRQVRQMLRRLLEAWSQRGGRPGTGPRECRKIGRQCQAWCAVAYLSAARPTEVWRLVHGHGEWLGPGVFRLHTSKTAARTGVARTLVLGDEALGWLARCRPCWTTPEGWSAAVRKALGPCRWPHALRHSAASRLRALGVAEGDVQQILGHQAPGALRHYVQTAHARLRRSAARLTLRFVRPCPPSSPLDQSAVGPSASGQSASGPSALGLATGGPSG